METRHDEDELVAERRYAIECGEVIGTTGGLAASSLEAAGLH
ncbi:hypothetical protein [Bosea sp. BIWAKO-01]|nr:hypothetical protein [Bosea sp. BIWAKO-01]